MKQFLTPVVVACTLALVSGCDKKPAASPQTPGTAAPAPASGAATKTAQDHGHEHSPASEHKESSAGHGGAVIQLGTSKIGTFDVKVTRDQGQIAAGKDAPIDATVTPAAGSTAKAIAVRFWIGTEDGKGSVKAKAEIEDPKDPNRWHTHTEIPNPIPAASKLWVEVEDDKGVKVAASFDLKN